MDIPTEDVTGRWFKYKNTVIVYILGWDIFHEKYVCIVDNNTTTIFLYPQQWKDLEPYEC